MKHEVFDMEMRQMQDDGVFEMLVLEAQDTLYAVRDMTPEQRAKNLPDIEEAAALLATAVKECQF